MIRYRDNMSPEDKAEALVDGLSGPQRRALLRHPSWEKRCCCGEMGMPYRALLIIADELIVHAWDRCQPRREWIEAP